eukprot:6007498-Amphidinium_carterae.1
MERAGSISRLWAGRQCKQCSLASIRKGSGANLKGTCMDGCIHAVSDSSPPSGTFRQATTSKSGGSNKVVMMDADADADDDDDDDD